MLSFLPLVASRFSYDPTLSFSPARRRTLWLYIYSVSLCSRGPRYMYLFKFISFNMFKSERLKVYTVGVLIFKCSRVNVEIFCRTLFFSLLRQTYLVRSCTIVLVYVLGNNVFSWFIRVDVLMLNRYFPFLIVLYCQLCSSIRSELEQLFPVKPVSERLYSLVF